jgi:hypothetical protein
MTIMSQAVCHDDSSVEAQFLMRMNVICIILGGVVIESCRCCRSESLSPCLCKLPRAYEEKQPSPAGRH